MAMQPTSDTHLTFNGYEVRYVMIDGKPWVVAADLAAPLEKTEVAIRRQVLRLKDSWKGVTICNTSTGAKNLTIVSKAGAIRIVERTNVKQGSAVAQFQDWCTERLDELLTTGYVDIRQLEQRQIELDPVRHYELCERLADRYPHNQEVQDRMRRQMLEILAPQRMDIPGILAQMNERVPQGQTKRLGGYVSQQYQFKYGKKPAKDLKKHNGGMRQCCVYTLDEIEYLKPYIIQWLKDNGYKRGQPKKHSFDIKRYFSK